MLLMGCFAIESNYVVNEDGSGSQTIRMTFPTALFGMGGTEVPPLEELQAEFESDPEMVEMVEALEANGGSMEFFSNDDGLGFAMTLNVPASDDFAAELEKIAATLPEDSSLPLGEIEQAQLTLERVGDEWQFSTVTEALSDEDLAEFAGDPSMSGMMDAFMDQITIVTRLSLPGEVKTHNADEVLPDGTLVWNMTMTDAGRTLSATSDVSTGLATPVIAGIVIGVLVVAGLGAMVLMRRRSAGAPPAPPTAAEPPPV